MMIQRPLIQLLVPAVALTVVAGCSSPSSDTTSSGTGSASSSAPKGAKASKNNDPVEVAFVTNNASDYWTIAHKGVDKAIEEMPGVKVDFKMPTNGAAEQKQIVNDEISRGVKAIAVSPVDPTNETPFINDTAKKALIITQDSDAPTSDRACYVGSDNVAAGNMAGEEVKKALPNGGKIMVFVGEADAQNAKERYQGLQNALKGSNVQILDLRTDQADHARAKSNAADTIVKYPDISCMVGLWSYNGPAILSALKGADKLGKIKVVCFDEQDETLAGVKAGYVDATIVQQPYVFGHDAVKLMADVLRGDKSAIPASKQIFIPTKVVNKGNVDDFTANLNKLRGRS